ncbi:MAG TPA: hypothetical protein VN631_13310, partial [Negativicutes bacterium]|nr:hypothetical protein [Negativicutes bacterium]
MRYRLRYFLVLGLLLLFPFVVSPAEGSPVVKTILLPPLKTVELQEMLQPFLKAEKITYSIIQGPQPKLVLVGEEAATTRIAHLIEKLAGRQVAKDLILITASMEETSFNKGSATGLNLSEIPISGNWKRTTSSTTYQNTSTSTIQVGDSSAAAVFRLRESNDDNHLVIAGQIAASNGMTGNLTLVEEVPYVVISANGSAAVQYLKAETIIKVKPTLLEYNEEQPEKSLVKLDINLQISVVGDQTNVSNPTITTRQIVVTRILPANQQATAVAALTSDEDILTDLGIP